MTKKLLKQISTLFFAALFVFATMLPAFAAFGESLPLFTTVKGIRYEIVSLIHNERKDAVVYQLSVYVCDGKTVPAGTIGCNAILYDSNENMEEYTDFEYNPGSVNDRDASYLNSGICDVSDHNRYFYSQGEAQLFNGFKYVTYTSNRTTNFAPGWRTAPSKLEDIQIQELRVRGVSKAYLGVLGQVLHFLERMATACISIVIAIGILFPMLVYKQQNEYGWIGSVFASIALFLIMGGLVWLSYKRGLYYTEQEVNTYNGISSEWNRMKYYLDMLAGVESQKDLRNYEQQNMIEEDVEKLCKNLRSGAKKAKGNLNKRLWIGQTTSDLSGLLVYLFTGLRAYVGMISIGQVVMYASSIIQFSESVSEFAETMGWLKETALICKDYVDYLDLEQKKYQGTIPVEKRQDHRFMVEFEHVSFRYPGMQTNVIQDLNLKFIIGEKMAIVGKNGAR